MRLSWARYWKQILFGQRYRLWVPVPSIATHMEKDISPCSCYAGNGNPQTIALSKQNLLSKPGQTHSNSIADRIFLIKTEAVLIRDS